MEEKIMYSNSVTITTSPYDINITFAFTKVESVDEQGNPKTKTIDSNTIVLSPQHYKVLTNIMNNVLNDYEKANGVININNEENKNT